MELMMIMSVIEISLSIALFWSLGPLFSSFRFLSFTFPFALTSAFLLLVRVFIYRRRFARYHSILPLFLVCEKTTRGALDKVILTETKFQCTFFKCWTLSTSHTHYICESSSCHDFHGPWLIGILNEISVINSLILFYRKRN